MSFFRNVQDSQTYGYIFPDIPSINEALSFDETIFRGRAVSWGTSFCSSGFSIDALLGGMCGRNEFLNSSESMVTFRFFAIRFIS